MDVAAESTPVSPHLKFVGWIEKLTKFLSFALLIIITATVFSGVISRYVFNSAFSWTEEFASWAFFWLICLGLLNGHRNSRHIAMNLLRDSTPGVILKIREFAVFTVVSLTTLLLFTAAWDLAIRLGGISVSLGWPNYIRVIPLPIACILSFIFILTEGIEHPQQFARRAVAVLAGVLLWWLFGYGSDMPQIDLIAPSLFMVFTFAVCIVIGVPIAFSMALSAFIATSGADLLPPAAVVQNMVTGGGKFVLLAIPFFLTAGYLMNLGGLSTRMIAFASSLVSHYRGGLAKVNVLNSLFMGGISGSSAADTASTTKILVPEMKKRGYDVPFSCAVSAGSAIIPNIVPPSIAILIYGSVSDASIARLFIGGVVPGILTTLLMMGVVHILAKRRGYEAGGEKATMKERLTAFGQAFPALLLVLWIIIGIRFGIVTATEAGVVAVLWALFVGVFLKRAFGLKDFYDTVCDAALDTGLIGLLIAVSVPFAWVLIADQVPQKIVGAVAGLDWGAEAYMIILVGCLIILGSFLEVGATIVIAVPLVLPVAKILSIDPTQFGIVVIISSLIGNVTPPVGMLVYISASIAKVPPTKVFLEVIPFLLACLAGVFLIIFNPWIVSGLWELMN